MSCKASKVWAKLCPEHKWPALNDFLIRQFLIANNGSVKNAILSVKRTAEWRRIMAAEKILSSPPPKMELIMNKLHSFFHGFTVDGIPVFLIASAHLFNENLASLISFEEFEKCVCWLMDFEMKRSNDISLRRKKKIYGSALIIDFNDMSSKVRKNIPYLRVFVCTLLNHYPNFLNAIIFINVPKIVSSIYSIFVTPFIDKRTSKKILMFRDNPIQFLKEKLGSNLPAFMGGECNCIEGCIPQITPPQSKQFSEIFIKAKSSIFINLDYQKFSITKFAMKYQKKSGIKIKGFVEGKTTHGQIQLEFFKKENLKFASHIAFDLGFIVVEIANFNKNDILVEYVLYSDTERLKGIFV